ncbi:peptidoglycan-binding protein [Nostoc sp. C057]|uniref:peptidoglycan-binding domain-containing protein n=1 Tax=Nostoc sp. C057 TaxID=2576903 RepID=UPI0015C33308|nr:peptidoglycan-binding domain-containing protein [Nostoc sp. C057]
MKFVSGKKGLNLKKFFRRYLIIPLLFVTFLFGIFTTYAIAQTGDQTCPKPDTKTNEIIKNLIIESIAADQSSLQVQCNSTNNSDPITISVNKPELKATLQGFSSGDKVNIAYTSEKDLTSISVMKSVNNGIERFSALIITGIALYLISYLIVQFACGKNLNKIFLGQDNRLSNSKSQMAIWFFVLLVGYISLSSLRVIHGGLGFVGGIGIPQNLLLLSGLSALTYGGAKVITQSQVNSKPNSKLSSSKDNGSLSDFFTDDDDENIDFGDLQMSFITLLAVVVYLLQLINFLGVLELHRLVTLPDVDTTILSIFGISQGAYLAKKAAVATGAKEPLKIGSEGEEVKKLKVQLKLITTDPNRFDLATEEAVKSFQKDKGLHETGIVDSKTRKKLGL